MELEKEGQKKKKVTAVSACSVCRKLLSHLKFKF